MKYKSSVPKLCSMLLHKLNMNCQVTFRKVLTTARLCLRHKNFFCYVALTRPKFENWVGRSGFFFFFFFFFFTYRERVEFSNIFFTVSKWGKRGRNAVQNAYTSHASAFLSHWIHILANSSPKSDIKKNNEKKKKKKKYPTLFFRILRSVRRGQHNKFFFFWPNATATSL